MDGALTKDLVNRFARADRGQRRLLSSVFSCNTEGSDEDVPVRARLALGAAPRAARAGLSLYCTPLVERPGSGLARRMSHQRYSQRFYLFFLETRHDFSTYKTTESGSYRIESGVPVAGRLRSV
jgi:hypothetical protein